MLTAPPPPCGPCRAWVAGAFWNTSQAIAHELGHTLWLGHSGAMLPGGGRDE